MQENVREWAHTLPNGFPFWKLESHWTIKFLKNSLRGQNSLDRGLHYIVENLLKHKCLKWACMIHLSISNTSYGQKKGQKSKCQFDSWPLKVKNLPKLHVCRRRAIYCWKTLNEIYNFVSNLTLTGGLHKKLWVSKVAKVPILGIVRFSIWES
jgi:hypothetical protein